MSSDGSFIVKNVFRKNENLKSGDEPVMIPADQAEFYTEEVLKCKEDICYFAEKYFTIISPGKGQHVIQLFDAQREFLQAMGNHDRVICLSSRQSSKTTSITIFGLFYTLFRIIRRSSYWQIRNLLQLKLWIE